MVETNCQGGTDVSCDGNGAIGLNPSNTTGSTMPPQVVGRDWPVICINLHTVIEEPGVCSSTQFSSET